MAVTYESPVYLEPIEHVYIHRKTGEKFTSVTKVLSSVEPHFDAEAVSAKIASQSDDKKQERYIGMSQVQILEYWQYLNDEANEYGTKVHDTLEKYLLSKSWFFPKDDLSKAIITGFDNLKIDLGLAAHPERIMFSEEYKLAGTSDLIVDINDIFFDVGDYKTNREFRFYDPYGYNTLLKPLDHLQACQYSIYTLQLSIYALMYEMEFPHKKCRQIYIMYWDKDNSIFKRIPVMYLKKEAKQVLELHKYRS